MVTKPNSLRLTRGGFLAVLALSMMGSAGVLSGCGGGGDDFREMLIGTWKTTAANSVGKTLTLNEDGKFSTVDPSATGVWTSAAVAGSNGIQLNGTKDVTVISVDSTTLKLSIDGSAVTYTKEAPTPAPAVFTALPASITATHTVGSSPCPQTLGTVTVNNSGSSSITVTIPAVADLSFDKTSFTVAAGASTTVTVRFTCDTVPPLSKTVTFNAAPSSGGASSSKTVSVQLNAGAS